MSARNPGVAAVIVVLIVVLGISVLYPAWWIARYRAMDLPSYYVAGLLTLNGKNPYHPVMLGMTAQSLGLDKPIYPYIYFPMIALIFMPLALMNYSTVQILWFLVCQGFFWLSVGLIIHLIRTAGCAGTVPARTRNLIVMGICGISYPLVVDYQNGQVNTLILFFAAAWLVLMMKRSDVFAGIALAVACMIKPQPLILLPYLLFIRRFRATASAAIAFAGGTVVTAWIIGWKNFIYYLTEVLPTFGMARTSFPPIPVYVPPNQSVYGYIARLFQTTEYSHAVAEIPGIVRPVSMVCVVSILLISAWRVWRWQSVEHASNRALLRDGAFLMVTSILVAPIVWDHHLVVASAAAAYLLCCRDLSYRSPRFYGFAICWIVMMAPLFPDHPFWAQNAWTAQGMSLKFFGILGFWIGFLNLPERPSP